MTSQRVEDWTGRLVTDGGLAPSTVRRIFNVVSGVMRYAERHGIVAAATTRHVELPPDDRDDEWPALTAEQAAAVALAMRPPEDTFVLVAAYCGTRHGEIAALTVKRLDWEEKVIKIRDNVVDVNGTMTWGTPKSKSSRRDVRVPDALMARLDEHVNKWSDPDDPDALLFTAPRGGPLRPAALHPRWTAAKEKALPEHLHRLRFHDLRHTSAALLIAQGAHPKAIADRLGHHDIRVTMNTYGHLLESVEQELAAGLNATLRQTTDPDG